MIEVSPFRQRDVAAMAEIWANATRTLPYSWQPATSFRQEVLLHDGEPFAILNTASDGWLVARDGEHTLGFAHCTTGRFVTEDHLTHRGFLRYLVTTPAAPVWAAKLLLARAEDYFRAEDERHITAFHIHTGYPCLLAGRGYFPAERIDLMEALGDAGYRVRDRWYLYEKSIHTYLIEYHPYQGNLSLQIQDSLQGITTFFVTKNARSVAILSLAYLAALSQHTGTPIATVRELRVEPDYRRQGIGRWLLQRAMNELHSRGVHRLLVDINHNDAGAQSLLVQLGFEEAPVTGYSYEKSLTSS